MRFISTRPSQFPSADLTADGGFIECLTGIHGGIEGCHELLPTRQIETTQQAGPLAVGIVIEIAHAAVPGGEQAAGGKLAEIPFGGVCAPRAGILQPYS